MNATFPFSTFPLGTFPLVRIPLADSPLSAVIAAAGGPGLAFWGVFLASAAVIGAFALWVLWSELRSDRHR